jgi:hypothetical protein
MRWLQLGKRDTSQVGDEVFLDYRSVALLGCNHHLGFYVVTQPTVEKITQRYLSWIDEAAGV